MRDKADEVLGGLRQHASGRASALRAGDLAKKMGLPGRIVSNALFSLVVDAKHPNVRRQKDLHASWYKYWWLDDGA